MGIAVLEARPDSGQLLDTTMHPSSLCDVGTIGSGTVWLAGPCNMLPQQPFKHSVLGLETHFSMTHLLTIVRRPSKP